MPMAYARFGRDSDVYVYADARGGFTCERCPDMGKQFRCDTAAAMADHLIAHQKRGDLVPNDAFSELRQESA